MGVLKVVLVAGLIGNVAYSADVGGAFWGARVGWAKGIGCKSGHCDSSVKTPDKITPMKVALTFDDGPSSIYTPVVLDILDKHHIKATFFVLGKNVESNKSNLLRMQAAGHVIGSHSWDHPNFWKLSPSEIDAQILNTERALTAIGIKPEYFRFPNGNSNEYSTTLLRKRGYKVVGWNVDTCDWGFSSTGILPGTSNKVCNGSSVTIRDAHGYLLNKITSHQGGIILMHDVQKTTALNLDRILTELKNAGYQFVQVNDRSVFPLLNQ